MPASLAKMAPRTSCVILAMHAKPMGGRRDQSNLSSFLMCPQLAGLARRVFQCSEVKDGMFWSVMSLEKAFQVPRRNVRKDTSGKLCDLFLQDYRQIIVANPASHACLVNAGKGGGRESSKVGTRATELGLVIRV